MIEQLAANLDEQGKSFTGQWDIHDIVLCAPVPPDGIIWAASRLPAFVTALVSVLTVTLQGCLAQEADNTNDHLAGWIFVHPANFLTVDT